jgi:uncharacterized membrane protein YeiH
MTLVTLIELGAVTSSAVFGILLAMRKKMDFVGLFTVGFAVAFGGGTLRDLFLDRHPLFWIANPQYPMLVFVLALVGALVPRRLQHFEQFISWPDALGLGLFTVVGTRLAVESGCHPFVSILIGVITGTFGGVIAEIICNEVPSLFRPAPLCATCSFTGAGLLLILLSFGMNWTLASLAGATVTVLFRLAALRWNLRLPAVHDDVPAS